jgi:hypothetical protein
MYQIRQERDKWVYLTNNRMEMIIYTWIISYDLQILRLIVCKQPLSSSYLKPVTHSNKQVNDPIIHTTTVQSYLCCLYKHFDSYYSTILVHFTGGLAPQQVRLTGPRTIPSSFSKRGPVFPIYRDPKIGENSWCIDRQRGSGTVGMRSVPMPGTGNVTPQGTLNGGGGRKCRRIACRHAENA